MAEQSTRRVARPRPGITPYQHALLIHELANHIRATADIDLMSNDEVRCALTSLRAFVGRTMLGLIDDSRALAARPPRDQPEEA